MKSLDLEKNILSLFSTGDKIFFKDKFRIIEKIGKPRPQKGECKTDIYLCFDDGEEVKISIKQDDADFVENKLSPLRAEALFGEHWKDIISLSILTLKDKFLDKQVYYPEKKGNIEANSYTLGWRVDIIRKNTGKLTCPILLSKEQILDIYTGMGLPADKRNCYINGEIIKNSGVATYYLEANNSYNLAQEVIDNLIPFDNFIAPTLYLTFRAVNYRKNSDKYEKSRWLGVCIHWNNGVPTIDFNHILNYKSNDIYDLYKQEF